MGRPFGLGLRSQLMLALIVAFGAAFVLLSLVTARLNESESAEEQRTRALGLAHPQRSEARSRESVENLRDIVAAIKGGNADDAERLTRAEASQAAEEVLRLLAFADDTASQTEAKSEGVGA